MAERPDILDQYGFERPGEFDFTDYDDFMSEYLSVLTRRRMKWDALIGNKEKISRSFKVKRYVRKGIPNTHRAMVWMHVSGAQYRMTKQPQLYQQLLETPLKEEIKESIRLDLSRTFPENIYFRETKDPHCQRQPLQNVLTALACNNKHIGYCQGLNFVAGGLLLIVKDEQRVFWLLDTLINTILPDLYTEDMNGLRTEHAVLRKLVQSKVPAVFEKMEKEGVSWAFVATKWFICLFIDVLPIDTVLRLWDCMFYEGSKILYRVAITLIQNNEQKIVSAKDLPEVVTVFKEITTGSAVVRCHDLMKSVFLVPGSFPKSRIRKLRVECATMIQTS